MLSLTESTWIALPVRKKLEAKHGARHAVQSSGKRDIAAAKRCRCDHGIILQIVRARVHVAVIVGRWRVSSTATRSECDPQESIIVNGVAQNGTSVDAIGTSDADAVEAVKRDDVAFSCVHAPDGPSRTQRQAGVDAAIAVAQRHRSGDVGADLIALDDYTGRSMIEDDAVGARSYHIGCAWRVAADGGIR
jgi:hypothetical protein